MKSIFYHKTDSKYDDDKETKYHFPSQYLARVEKSLHDYIVYYGPIEGKKGRYYSAVAKVEKIAKDINKDNHYYAHLIDYLNFDNEVEYRENGGYEKKLIQNGKVNGGLAQNAVRSLEEEEFAAIVSAGLSTEDKWPDRYDEQVEDFQNIKNNLGFYEDAQPTLDGEPYERPIIEQLTKRKWRDKKFSQHIRIAYDRTCAFTGLRLINGKGRPEVEAAHIIPVSEGGNDSIRNGIALSGTVHWMFDRGLLSLEKDFTILQSRHLNHDVSSLIHKNFKARVPKEKYLQPHPEYLEWHRENIFKS